MALSLLFYRVYFFILTARSCKMLSLRRKFLENDIFAAIAECENIVDIETHFILPEKKHEDDFGRRVSG